MNRRTFLGAVAAAVAAPLALKASTADTYTFDPSVFDGVFEPLGPPVGYFHNIPLHVSSNVGPNRIVMLSYPKQLGVITNIELPAGY